MNGCLQSIRRWVMILTNRFSTPLLTLSVQTPAEMLQDSDLRASIDYWLDQLPHKQREVIARRFGLRGYEMSTLEEVGKEIGLTRERVRQIQVEALKRLRDVLEKQGLTGESIFGE